MKKLWIVFTLLLWIPTMLIWCVWAPLFHLMVKVGTKVNPRNLDMRWRWMGVYARLSKEGDE